MISCNISVYRWENIVTQLKTVSGYFDRIRVTNSNFKENRIHQILNRFKDIDYDERVFDAPVLQFGHLLSKAEPNEWFMYLSDDEIPSVPLLENLFNDIDGAIAKGSNCVFYPFINVREYTPTVELTEKIRSTIAWYDHKIGEEFGINVPEQWTAIRLIHNDGAVKFTGSVHEGVTGRIGDYRSCYPILHYKLFDGFILSALWQSVCDLQSNVPKEIRDEQLKAIAESGIEKNADSIYQHLKTGKISQSLKDWMWKYRHHESPYVFPWFIVYYFEFHPEELPEDFWDSKLLNEWRNHVLANHAKLDVMQTRLHRLMKQKFLKRGIKELNRGISL